MANEINRRCVIIAGSPEADTAFIKSAVMPGDYVMCADKGLEYAIRAGVKPDIIVGDLDSYNGEIPEGIELIKLLPEKDDTDTFHCIDVALSRGYRDFLILAATGGRLDHTLSNLYALEYILEHGAQGELASTHEYVFMLDEGDYSFSEFEGHTFSVFPFGSKCVILTYSGTKYPLNQGEKVLLFHSNPKGTSNIFTSNRAALNIISGKAVVFINM